MPEPADDPLDQLREQIRETQRAAERLAGHAAGARASEAAGDVPPAGWATPEDRAERTTEVQALVALLDACRDLIPDELEGQFRDVVRQVLLLLRALIDWWVARIDPVAPSPAPAPDDRLQDIPID